VGLVRDIQSQCGFAALRTFQGGGQVELSEAGARVCDWACGVCCGCISVHVCLCGGIRR
jgi:hypothetical protein